MHGAFADSAAAHVEKYMTKGSANVFGMGTLSR